MVRSVRPPPFAPHPGTLRLRELGWSVSQIATSLGASSRTVARWMAGYARPLPMFDREITKLVESGVIVGGAGVG